VKLHSFTASPPTIQAFGKSTLQWSVTGPPPDDPLITIEVRLEDVGVSPNGSTTVAPSSTKTFHLTAGGDFASRLLGTVQVIVDFGVCQVQDLPAGVFSALAKQPIDDMFAVASGSWGGQRPSRGDYVMVTRATDGATAAAGGLMLPSLLRLQREIPRAEVRG
jgi:hypothetical protein